MATLGSVVQSAVDPWAIQQRIGTTDARYALNSILMPQNGLSYIDYRSGVMASGDTGGSGGSSYMAMKVRPGTGMAVTVEVGNCVINTPNQGAYMCCLSNKATLPITAASSTTNRIDLVVARVYDDQNSVIGSPGGTRKFTVEVWKGDETSGSNPVVPSLTDLASGGVIPLAQVYVSAGTSSITTSMITDKRGPGLVARGGVRGLYGQDALDATAAGHTAAAHAGAYPGDQRWIHTNGFQHQIFYGSGDDPLRSGWRGVHNCLVYNANSTYGTNWVRGTKKYMDLCYIDIPYPGTPFSIYPTARAAFRVSPGVSLDLRITIGSRTGPAVNWSSISSSNGMTGPSGGDERWVMNVQPVMYGPFTGPTRVWLSAHLYDVWGDQLKGFAHWSSEMRENLLQVLVYPSTVQPPNNVADDGSGDDIAEKTP